MFTEMSPLHRHFPWSTLIASSYLCHLESQVQRRDDLGLERSQSCLAASHVVIRSNNKLASPRAETEFWVKGLPESCLADLFSILSLALLILWTFPLSRCDRRSSKTPPLRPNGKQPEHWSADCTDSGNSGCVCTNETLENKCSVYSSV